MDASSDAAHDAAAKQVLASAMIALQSSLVGASNRSLLAAADLMWEVLELLRRPGYADALATVQSNLTQNLTNQSKEIITNQTYTTLRTLFRNECSTTTTTTTTTS